MPVPGYPWRLFAALLAMGGLALFLAVPRPLSAAVLVIVGVAFAVAVALGLLAGRSANLGAPLLEAWLYGTPMPEKTWARLSGGFLAGAGLGGALVIALRFVLIPAEPALRARFVDEAGSPGWKQWVIAFDSAILEELFFRLLILSCFVWLARRLTAAAAGPPAALTLWVPNLLAALAFALAHVPRWLALAPGDLAVPATVVALNVAAGLLFGYLFVRRGIETAMVAHFAADVVLHVLGPSLLAT